MITNLQIIGAVAWIVIFGSLLILYIMTWIVNKKRPRIFGSDDEEKIEILTKRIDVLENKNRCIAKNDMELPVEKRLSKNNTVIGTVGIVALLMLLIAYKKVKRK